MQKARQPTYSFLYSLQGFRYCDLLLGQGRFRDVPQRAQSALGLAQRLGWRLDIGLDHLSLGWALLLAAEDEGIQDLSDAACQLDQAVDSFRRAGSQDHLPRGFLARAELHRATGDLPAAERDLEEALAIAERGSMGLHQADAHLGYARLYVAMGERDKARLSLATAKKMVGEMGYHRRDGEVEELERELGQASV